MSKSRKTTLLKYGISIAVCVLLAALYLYGQASELGELSEQSLQEQYRLLCNAFTIPGMLLILSGLLVAVTNEGSLDGVGYLGHYLVNVLLPGRRRNIKKYYDYITEKRKKRVSGYSFLFVVGGICMLIAVVFLGLFYKQYQ